MEFTKNIINYLEIKGKNISVYSKTISKELFNYKKERFTKNSVRSYYFWRAGKRPIPLKIVLKIMEDKKNKNSKCRKILC